MIFLSVLLLITLFPFSVYAEPPIYVQVNPDYTPTVVGNGTFTKLSTVSPDRPIYLVADTNYIYWVSPVSDSYLGGYWGLSVNNSNAQSSYGTSTNGLYWYGNMNSAYNRVSSANSGLTQYADINSAISALDDALNIPLIRYPYTFQNGYLFVYDLGQSGSMYSFDLSSKSEEYSNIGSIPFPDTNQCYWFDNSLPEIDETTIPSSSAIYIVWSKGSKTNIFGQTQDMVATISGTSSGRYLYVYNPPVHYKWSGSSNPTASEVINYPVTIDGVSSGDNFYIYDSYARLSDFNQGGKVTGTITGETGYGSVSSDGAITVTTSQGAIFNQTSGGSTDISGANGGSLAENINGLKETLDNFLNQFVQLLSAPISHIRQLISASHEFLSEFSHFFDWLPSEVSGFVISAFIVMVAIGIFKLFL